MRNRRGDRCTFHRLWLVEEMIAGLEKRGQGSRTEVDELGAKMTTACPTCKRVSWAADILWVSTDTWAGGRAASDRLNPECPSDVSPVYRRIPSTLSVCEVEELLAPRGIEVSREAVRPR